MSKISVALFIVAVASVAHAQETIEQAELQEAKDECIRQINSVINEIIKEFQSVERFLDEFSRQDIFDVVGPSVWDLSNFLKKIQTIDVSKVDPESEEFDEVIDNCTTLVMEGSDGVAYIKDFNKRIWAPA